MTSQGNTDIASWISSGEFPSVSHMSASLPSALVPASCSCFRHYDETLCCQNRENTYRGLYGGQTFELLQELLALEGRERERQRERETETDRERQRERELND